MHSRLVYIVTIFMLDIKKASIDAAKFLRGKSSKVHKDKNFEGLFSGEHEFVAECYRRLVQRNGKYPSKVFID